MVPLLKRSTLSLRYSIRSAVSSPFAVSVAARKLRFCAAGTQGSNTPTTTKPSSDCRTHFAISFITLPPVVQKSSVLEKAPKTTFPIANSRDSQTFPERGLDCANHRYAEICLERSNSADRSPIRAAQEQGIGVW